MEIEMKAKAVGISLASGEVFVVLQSSKKDLLSVRIEMHAAQAIHLELEKVKPARPLTHELIKRVMEKLKTTLRKIVITDASHSYALLYLEKNGATITADATPGDAIALALRSNAPIYVESKALEEYHPYSEDQRREWFDSLDPDDLKKI